MKTNRRFHLLALILVSTLSGFSQTWRDANGSMTAPVEVFALDSLGRVFAGIYGAVEISTDSGETWLRTGLSGTVKKLICLPGSVVIASTDIGLKRSTDGGISWTSPATFASSVAQSLALASDGSVYFATTLAVYRSTDSGNNWLLTGTSFIRKEFHFLTEAGPGNLFSASDSGVYSSTDHGSTWNSQNIGLDGGAAYCLAIGANGTIYAGTDSAVFHSTDGGNLWTNVLATTGRVTSLATGSGDDIYALVADSALFHSTDAGQSWNRKDSSLNKPPYGAFLVVTRPHGDQLFLGTKPVSGSAHVFRSDDKGSTWIGVGTGLVSTVIPGIALCASGSVAAAVAGRGIFLSPDTGLSWQSVAPALKGAGILSLERGRYGVLFAGTDSAGMWRSTDQGLSWQQRSAVAGLIHVDCLAFPTASRILAGTISGILASTDGGTNWSQAGLQGQTILSLRVVDSLKLLAGSSSGLYKSTDGGSTWNLLGLSGSSVQGITVVTTSTWLAGTDGGILRSTDGGANWSGPLLSGLSTKKIIVVSASVAYAGTSGGVYKTSDGGVSWNPAGLSSKVVSMTLNSAGNLFVGTDGEGVFVTVLPVTAFASQTAWMSVGSLQSWYSSMGSEIEEGRANVMQDGLQWPAIHPNEDMEASKGLWIGTSNFTDVAGKTYAQKVVHVGPRVTGNGEFVPVMFDMVSRFTPPVVSVGGQPSFDKQVEPHRVDSTISADRMIVSVVNTAIGLTVTRKIMQFSLPGHDNFIVNDYTFTNTGCTGSDADPFLAGQTLTGLYFYWMNRYAVCREVRYMVNNSSGWGINTMNDARGFPPDISAGHLPTDIKCQFSWHGFHNAANKPTGGSGPTFDNIGAPIFDPAFAFGDISPADTVWRLGGAQFVGTVHLHADKSSSDTTNDPNQPFTTNYVSSDDPVLTQHNSQFDSAKMRTEYLKMSEGHTVRHAWAVDPTGSFDQQAVMGNISSAALGGDGSPGGWSSATGYGPYTLGPGQSVHIVFAEAANGLSQEEAIRIGRLYKSGAITTKAKNDSVFLGQGRLFETFRQAVADYNSGFAITRAPNPPGTFSVTQNGKDGFSLAWSSGDNEHAYGFKGYRVYRAQGARDSAYIPVFECGEGTTHPAVAYACEDSSVVQGLPYFYYVVSFGTNDGKEVASSRYYTQTYTPAIVGPASVHPAPVPRSTSVDQNFPNPFNPATIIRYQLSSRSVVSLHVYDVLGRQVATLVDEAKEAGNYSVEWNAARFSSGVYFYRLHAGSFVQTRKLVLLR